VLPEFICRWLRDRSGKGHIRHTDNPNLRVQDGLKLRWLCDRCENSLSRYKTAFATKLFYPWHGGAHQIRYDEWPLKFCVSVYWRVLGFARGRNKDEKYTDEQKDFMDEAKERRRAFLNDEKPNPGAFEQDLLIFDVIESTIITDLPNNMNRFMTCAATLDVVVSGPCLTTIRQIGAFHDFRDSSEYH
jgi:hypothetical protein